MKHLITFLFFAALVLIMRCDPLPPDPNTLPENASVKVVAINMDNQFTEPVKVSEETNITVTFQLHLPEFIDSVSADIEASNGESEYHTVIKKPWDSTTFEIALEFPSSGTKTLAYTAWITGNIVKNEKVIFDVASRITNAAPVLNPKTIELLSEKGVAATRNLMPYVTDPDNDRITFEIQNQGAVQPFILKDSLLKSTAELEVGTYVLSITVSDGMLTDAGTIIWKVYTPPEGAAEPVDDIAETVKNTPVTINVLENDVVPSGSLLSYISQGKHGKALLNDGKVLYTPKTGYTGGDTLFYLINGTDTGRVYITVKEPAIANRSPVWSPDTVELYSQAGITATANIAYFAKDPDNDALVFTVSLPEGASFAINKSVIASLEDLSAGTYYLGVDISDGEKVIGGVVKWTVYEDKGNTVEAVDDEVQMQSGTTKVIDVLDNDVVVSGSDVLLVTAVKQGKHGTASIKNGSQVVYTPVTGFAGKDTALYVVNGQDTGNIYITVRSVQGVTGDKLTVSPDGTASVDVVANDNNGGSIVSVVQGSKGTATFDGTSVTYTADAGSSGTDTVKYITDAGDTGLVVITISEGHTNSAPVWSATSLTKGSVEGEDATFDLNTQVSDADGDQLTFNVTSGLGNGFLMTDGWKLVTAGSPAAGEYTFSLTVSDGEAEASATLKWTIVPASGAELDVNDDNAEVTAGSSVTVNVLENDHVVSGEATLVITSQADGTHGTVVATEGGLKYTPAAGFSGNDSFIYVVNGTDTGHVTVTVHPPRVTLVNDVLSVEENGSGSVNVLVNDTVSAGNTLKVVSVIGGTLGTATVEGDSVVRFTAKEDASGIDTVRYVLSTGDTGKVVVAIAETVYSLTDDVVSVLQGRSREIMVLANDQVSSGALKVTSVTAGAKGTATYTESSIIYTANTGASGTDEVIYTVNGGKASARVAITLLSIEITANNDSLTIDEDAAAVTVDVLANDVITEGEVMTISSVTGAKFGTAELDAQKKKIIYTPLKDSSGVDVLTYTVNGAVDGTLKVTVNPVNDLPVFTAKEDDATLAEGTKDTLLFKAVDADGTPVSFSLVGKPTWVSTVGTTDSIKVIAAPGYGVASSGSDGTATFTVRGISGNDTINHSVTITVTNVNSAPVFTNPTATLTMYEGETKTVQFIATDAQNDNLTYSVTGTVPSWITYTTTGGISLVAAPDYSTIATTGSASASITCNVSDGAETTIHTLSVTVNSAFTLSVSRSPTAGGTVTIVKDTAAYPAGTVVTLTAHKNANYRFDGWSGDTTITSVSDSVISITMKKDRSVTAKYKRQYTLTMAAGTGGSVSPTGSMVVDSGVATTIAATAKTGYKFGSWSTTASGVTFGSTGASSSVTLTAGSATVSAVFKGLTFNRTYASVGSYSPIFSGGIQMNDTEYFAVGTIYPSTGSKVIGLRVNYNGDTVVSKSYGGSNTVKSIQSASSGFLLGATQTYTSANPNMAMITVAQNGNYTGNYSFGDTANDEGRFASQAGDGNFFVGGHTYSTTTNYDFYLVKVNSLHSEVWKKTYDLDGSFDQINDGVATSDYGCIMAGNHNMGGGVWVVKVNSSGVVSWNSKYTTVFSGALGNELVSVRQTSDGGYIFGGKTINGAVIFKANSSGTLLWQKTYGDIDYANSVRQTADGGYVFVGTTYSIGPGNSDIVIYKADANGEETWKSIFGTVAGSEVARAVEPTSDGGYLITGTNSSEGILIKTNDLGKVE